MPGKLLIVLSVMLASSAQASWKATTPQANEAIKDSRIQAVLMQTEVMDRAILARDEAAFATVFGDDARVNNPYNRIASKADALRNIRTGLIDYTKLERSLEYASVRPNGEVLLMGEEMVTPVRKARFANKLVHRRTTEIWTPVGDSWKLSVRQATIYRAK